MTDNDSLRASPPLQAALVAHRAFLEGDDDLRGRAIEQADDAALQMLAADVGPLFDEINALLDRFDATPHPVAADLEQLEYDLHSLAQAALEAQMAIDDRAS